VPVTVDDDGVDAGVETGVELPELPGELDELPHPAPASSATARVANREMRTCDMVPP
jgi:hypothetical protein